jgi:MFS family permease
VSRRTPLVGWLVSEAVCLTGTRVSLVAVPWLVLTSTGSATWTGLAAFAEMTPYVVAKAAAGPVMDRVGARTVSLLADATSVVVVAAVPLLHLAGHLPLPLLLVLVALAGLVRGPGDGAKQAMVPSLVEHAQVPLERATGLGGAVERLASTVGAAIGGGLVAAVGPAPALVVDAASFGVSALVLATTTRGLRHARTLPAPAGVAPLDAREDTSGDTGGDASYVHRLREGWDFLRRDRVLVAVVTMVAVTNLLDQAYSAVLVPVWARQSGGGAGAVGLLFAAFAGAAVLGSVLAASFAARLPRFTTYLLAFLVCGAPRFVVLALPSPLWAVLGVAVAGGFAAGFINPVLGAVIFERIPAPLVGRVSSLTTALCWVGIPFGGLVGGVLVGTAGPAPALLLVGGAYLLATLLPAVQPRFRRLDTAPGPAAAVPAH